MDLIQSVEGLKGKRLSPCGRGSSTFKLKLQHHPQVSRLLACPGSFELANFCNYVSQLVQYISPFLPLSLSLSMENFSKITLSSTKELLK